MNAVNRVLGIIVGLLLTAAGVLGVLAYAGVLPGIDNTQPLLGDGLREQWSAWGSWAVGGLIAVGVVAALAGAWLIIAELRSPRASTMSGPPVPTPAGGGRLRVATATVTHAFTRDLQAAPGIDRARVTLRGSAPRPELLLRLVVTPEANLPAVNDHLHAALRRFATTTGLNPDLRDVTVQLARHPVARVR